MKLCVFLLILIAWIEAVVSDSCCGSSSCSESCPWENACNDGKDYDCMDGISGLFKCRDKSLCKNYYECDDSTAARRSGQLCNGFPWYNGGYPLNKFKTDSEIKTNNCTKPSANGNYCEKWSSLDYSLDEFNIGRIQCNVESDNGRYCQEWRALGSEYQKCWNQIVTYTDQDGHLRTETQQVCCNDDTKNLDCCKNVCPVSFYTNPHIQYERIDCWCKQESRNGNYCHQWYCEDYKASDAYGTISHDQPVEHEWYTCSDQNNNLLSASYCSSWDGQIDSVKEFEVSTCDCATVSSNNQYCESWICREKGYGYWWPNLLWNLFSTIFGSLPLWFLIFIDLRQPAHDMYLLIVLVFHFFWAGGSIMLGVWKSGIGTLIISGGILFVVPTIVILFIRLGPDPNNYSSSTYGRWNNNNNHNNNYELTSSNQENQENQRNQNNSQYHYDLEELSDPTLDIKLGMKEDDRDDRPTAMATAVPTTTSAATTAYQELPVMTENEYSLAVTGTKDTSQELHL